MNNNLLRCDLSIGQLEALAESKGEWWLLDGNDYFLPNEDTLLREWNNFKFYFCDEEGLTTGYLITPEGYFLAIGCSVLEEIDEEKNVSEQIEKQFQEIVNDAIATLLHFPQAQGQLSLLELINV